MPEYYDGPPGRKPSEKELHERLANEHNKKQEVRIDAAKRHAEAHKQPGPAERMYGQDRFINTNQGRNPDPARSVRRAELTPAQQEMKARREAARAEDLKQARTPFDDKKYMEKPKDTPTR